MVVRSRDGDDTAQEADITRTMHLHRSISLRGCIIPQLSIAVIAPRPDTSVEFNRQIVKVARGDGGDIGELSGSTRPDDTYWNETVGGCVVTQLSVDVVSPRYNS